MENLSPKQFEIVKSPSDPTQPEDSFVEKYDLKNYTPEELNKIRKELENLWRSRTNRIDTAGLETGSLSPESLAAYGKFSRMLSEAESDEKWKCFLNEYCLAREVGDFDKAKNLLSEIETRGITNWPEILEAYQKTENFIKEYRQLAHTDEIDKYGEMHKREDFSPADLGRAELIAMLENRLLLEMTPLIRCRNKLKKQIRERQAIRSPKDEGIPLQPAA